jgi:NAD(P)H-flavin reductase
MRAMHDQVDIIRLGDHKAGKKPRSMREVTLEGVEPECPGVHTLHFKDSLPLAPGQFYMIWVPGKGEIPLTASIISPGDRRGLTVAAVGEKTHALNRMRPGDRIGIRGPFGCGFHLRDDWLWVGGGIGASPMVASLSALVEAGQKATVILGSTRADALILRRRAVALLEDGGDVVGGAADVAAGRAADVAAGGAVDVAAGEAGAGEGDKAGDEADSHPDIIPDDGIYSTPRGSLHICTDDGSAGYRGLASQLAHSLIMERKESGQEMFKGLAACGPEPMMLTLLELAGLHGLRCQFSLERFMKCGVGICDSCTMDGLQICRDGPVFDGAALSEMGEFGRFVRDLSGRKIEVWRHGRRYTAAEESDGGDADPSDPADS